jgi:hypothetical protein
LGAPSPFTGCETTLADDVVAFKMGQGIAYDSEARAEFEEMRLKAQPLLEALGVGAVSPRHAVEACALKS